MKKLSYLFIVIISFIGINNVNADTLNLNSYYDSFNSDINFYNSESGQIIFNHLLSTYNDNYSQDYKYYFLTDAGYRLYYCKSPIRMTFTFYGDSNDNILQSSSINSDCNSLMYDPNYAGGTYYDFKSSGISDSIAYPKAPGANSFPIISNYPLVFNSNDIFDKVILPSYNLDEFNITSISIDDGDYFPSYLSLYDGSYERNIFEHYTEINLNDYDYVALNLKDYTLRNDNINQFSTNIYTKGQLCLTPVYDYGMKEKVDYYSGYQVDRCSVVYDDFTPVRTYILKQDLENHAIYYLKAYDTNIENKVKIDTSLFDITYVTQENANNPSVNINGRSYPTIPYSDLSSTSTKSEAEDYISGYSENITNYFDFSSILSSPIKALQNVWSAITAILTLISTFIGLLPATMQAFLYSSFALAIVLGIIKILI